MAAINGMTGSVTFASGYVTSAHQWEINTQAEALDITPFSPVSSFTSAVVGIKEWSGSYRCWKRADATTTIATAGYVTNPTKYRLRITCESLDSTAFTAAYRAKTGGLLSAEGSWESIVDDTTALPTPGTTADGVFTLATGLAYTVPLIVTRANVSVAADGSSRLVSCDFKNSGSITLTGAPPIAGTAGAATFLACTGRQYTGSILTTAVEIAMSADRTDGEYTFEFDGNGVLTAA